MTVKRTYQCNLCNDTHDADRLRGLYWEAGLTGPKLVERSPREVEHHICAKCLDSLRDFKFRQ